MTMGLISFMHTRDKDASIKRSANTHERQENKESQNESHRSLAALGSI
jgi:hypothetical protein